MHSSLIAFVLRKLWPRRGYCPACRAQVQPPPPLRERPWETVARCGACGWVGSAVSLRRREDPPSAPTLSPSVQPPENSVITHTDDTMEETWTLPKSGKSGCLLPFGILWLLMSSVASFVVWSGQMPQGLLTTILFRGVFGVGFPLIGAGLIYAGLRVKYARHWLSLSAEWLTLEREMFGRRKRKSLRRSDITRVELREFYSRNYQPVYGIEIRGRDGKLRFGSALNEPDKAWLAQDLKRALGLGMAVETAAKLLTMPASSSVEMDDRGHSVEWRLPPSRKSGLTMAAVILMASSAAFLTLTATMFQLPPPEAGPMRILAAVFIIPFYISPVLIFAVGLLLFREGRRLARQSAVLRVDAAGLSLDFLMPHSQTHDAWRRDEVERIQTASWTRINQREILHAEVVTAERAVRFGAGCPVEELEAICARARAVLFGQMT